jgi:PTS system mannose-specific IIB component/fructoselysine and glucoselysine-specific PTS system IIB component
MPIVLYRVDERLIHGQVVIGWGSQLRPDRYLVVDDTLATTDWEQDLYRLAVGDGSAVSFHSVEDARTQLPDWSTSEERSVLLTRDVDTMLRLARGRLLSGEAVNLGGIHHAEGRSRVRSYLYLDDADRGRVRALEEEGVDVSGRDLPGSLRVSLHDLLEEP